MRRRKMAIATAGQPSYEASEITGLHEVTMSTIRGTRASIGELIQDLKSIQKQISDLVDTGDVAPPKTESNT